MKKTWLIPLIIMIHFSTLLSAEQLSFKNPTLESGDAKKVGAVYRFSNVALGTDALVKVVRFNDSASLAEIDNASLGLDDAFQPTLQSSPFHSDSSVDFEIDFVSSGTTTPKAISFKATGADIDGDGDSIKEYISLSAPSSYSLENQTRLRVTQEGLGLYIIPKTTANVADITVSETRNIITASYENVSTISYRIGAKDAYGTERYNSLYFKDVSYSHETVTQGPKPFSCEAESFVSFNESSNGPGDGASRFYTYALTDGTLLQDDDVSNISGVNTLGYNVKDNFLWGWNIREEKVVRIDANKNATLFDIDGLDERFYVAGDVDANGILYLFSRGNDWQKTHIARVDLNTMQALSEVTLTKAINTADFSFDPQSGKLYFIEHGTDDLYSITMGTNNNNISGTVHKERDLGTVADVIITFFDKDSNFYFNVDTSAIYKVNVKDNTSAVVPFSTLSSTLRNGDGARCANAAMVQPEHPVEPGVPFSCMSAGAVVSYSTTGHANTGNTNLNYYNLADGTIAKNHTYDDGTLSGVNSIGYNVQDDYIWGFNIPEKKIVRIDANHNYRFYEMDSPTDVVRARNYYNAADVSADGVLYLKADMRSKRLDRVKLDGSKTTLHVLSPINLSKAMKADDFAFNPKDKKIYYVDGDDKELKRIDISGTDGTIVAVGGESINISEKPIVIFFDKEGNLYFNDEEKIKKVTFDTAGNILSVGDFSTVQGMTQGDGARCANAPMTGTAFSCDDTMYFSNASHMGTPEGEDDSKMWLHKINREQTPFRFDPIGEPFHEIEVTRADGTTHHNVYNALSYNPADNYMYALIEHVLVKIDSSGAVDVQGPVLGLPKCDAHGNYYAGSFGAIESDGKSYFYITSGFDSEIYKIDIDVDNRKVVDTIVATEGIYAWDVAADKAGDYLYYIDRESAENNNQLKRVKIRGNDKGKVEPIGSRYKDDGTVDVIFYDASDKIYVLYHDKGFYEVNKDTGARTPISNAPVTANLNDAAMCPLATVDLKPIIRIGDVEVKEGDSGTTDLIFPITYSGGDSSAVTFHYTTQDGTATISDHDYEAVQSTGSGASITVKVVGDRRVEADETLSLILSNIQGALYHDSLLTATGTILNDDVDTFNAWDKEMDDDYRLMTKVVGKPFSVQIGLFNSAGTGVSSFDGDATQVRIVDVSDGEPCETNTESFLTSFTAFSYANFGQNSPEFTSSQATTKAQVQFWWKDKKGLDHVACSSDSFSIRPAKYDIHLTPATGLKAGEDFNITITALSDRNMIVTTYEASVGSFRFDYNETKAAAGCIRGRLNGITDMTFNQGQLKFVNVNYDDIGKLKFSIEEILGAEYAIIDAADTPDANRSIYKAEITSAEIKPANITLSQDFKNKGLIKNGTNYVFYADYSEAKIMSAELNSTVSAKNSQGATVKNFTAGCYAKNVDLSVGYSLPTATLDITYPDNQHVMVSDPASLHYTIVADQFKDGNGSQALYLNLGRAINVAKNPALLTLGTATAMVDGLSHTQQINQSVTYIYGRANVPSPQTFIGKEHNITVNYEVYCDEDAGCVRSDFGLGDLSESEDTIRWYIMKGFITTPESANFLMDYSNPQAMNRSTSCGPSGHATHMDVTRTSPNILSVEVVGSLPYRDVVVYSPSHRYLTYDAIDATATKHRLKTSAMPDTQNWLGKGDLGSTVDDTTSTGNGLHKLNW